MGWKSLRRRDWLRWAILFVFYSGLSSIVIGAAATALYSLAVRQVFGEALSNLILNVCGRGLDYWRLNQDDLFEKFKIASAVVSVATAAYGLLNAWHYLESELPRRMSELLERARTWDNEQRSPLLARAWLAGSDDEFAASATHATARNRLLCEIRSNDVASNARWYAASSELLENELFVVRNALSRASHRSATAHLIKGRQLSGAGRDLLAAEEYEKALLANPSDLEALSIAAGCERRLGRDETEVKFLKRLEDNAQESIQYRAKALRRQAELLLKTQDEPNWETARKLLDEAIRSIASPSENSGDLFLERGRLLILFCEARTKLGRRNYLANRANAAKDAMKSQQFDVCAPFEEGGEQYGLPRAQQMLEALNSDTSNQGDTGGRGDAIETN